MNDANVTTAIETDDAVAYDYGAAFRSDAELDLFGGVIRLDPTIFAADGTYIGALLSAVEPKAAPAPVAAPKAAPAKRVRRRDYAFVR